MSTFGLACLDLHTLNPEMISMLNMAKKNVLLRFLPTDVLLSPA